MIKIGSLFAGIGGFELGLERAIPNSETIWQVEQEPFCQKILKKHWPHSKIYNDVRAVGAHNLEQVDIICGGFPCQDISTANTKAKGLEGEKSSLWFEMLRIIRELRPRVVVLENVPTLTVRGLSTILGALTKSGYDSEWEIISAAKFGAVHLRKRWFCVAYPSSLSDKRRPFADANQTSLRQKETPRSRRAPTSFSTAESKWGTGDSSVTKQKISNNGGMQSSNYWRERVPPEPIIHRMDDGISTRLDKIKALGNAIVPQCSEYIGRHIFESGVLS